jgi:hypothetical protein
LHPEGDVVEQSIVLVDRLPPPASDQDVESLIAPTLVCATGAGESSPQGDYSSLPPAAYLPPSFPSTPVVPPAIPGITPQPPTTQIPGNLTPAPSVAVIGDAVIYAIVWVLPLALLAFGGYFGGALTREITLAPSA